MRSREGVKILLGKLQDKVNVVIEVFPWYKELIGEEGIEYNLSNLPLMTSKMLETYYYNEPVDPTLMVYRTSGTSTGLRKAIRFSMRIISTTRMGFSEGRSIECCT